MRQQHALGYMSKKTIEQATGPSAAPPPRQAPSRCSKSGNRISEGSVSDKGDSDSSSSRRGRSPSKRRRVVSPLARPPGHFSGAYPSAPVAEYQKYQEYKIKFAQVVDDMRFDIQELVGQIPRVQLRTPTILTFKTRAPEARVVENIDDIVPEGFRVHYREGTFAIRAPKQEMQPSAEARQRRRRRKPTRAPQHRPPAPHRAAAPKRGPWQASSKPTVQRRRKDRLVFRSGVLEGPAAPDRAPSPFTV